MAPPTKYSVCQCLSDKECDTVSNPMECAVKCGLTENMKYESLSGQQFKKCTTTAAENNADMPQCCEKLTAPFSSKDKTDCFNTVFNVCFNDPVNDATPEKCCTKYSDMPQEKQKECLEHFSSTD